MTDRLDPADLVTHKALLQRLVAAQAEQQFWSQHLAQKYGLGPNDGVDADGVIVRAEKADG